MPTEAGLRHIIYHSVSSFNNFIGTAFRPFELKTRTLWVVEQLQKYVKYIWTINGSLQPCDIKIVCLQGTRLAIKQLLL